jgi:hypothetical protein
MTSEWVSKVRLLLLADCSGVGTGVGFGFDADFDRCVVAASKSVPPTTGLAVVASPTMSPSVLTVSQDPNAEPASSVYVPSPLQEAKDWAQSVSTGWTRLRNGRLHNERQRQRHRCRRYGMIPRRRRQRYLRQSCWAQIRWMMRLPPSTSAWAWAELVWRADVSYRS